MHLAATQCSLRGLSLLLANGASINANDYRGRTPLHAACATCHGTSSTDGSHCALACIELLLSSGALEDARDAKGQTALHLAVLAGNLSAARALIAAGATAMADKAGNSPLHLAASQGHSDIIQLLVVGNRDESPRKPPASSGVGGRAQRRTAVVNGDPAFDVGLSAGEKGPGNVSVRQRETTSTATDGETFGDDGLVVRAVTSQVHHFEAAREKHSKVWEEDAEEIAFSRGSHSRYDGPEVPNLTGGSPAYNKQNRHSGSETSSLKLVPNDQDDILRRDYMHGKFQQRWQEKNDAHNRLFETSTRHASRTSEEDGDGSRYGGHQALGHEHRRRSEGKGGKRHNSARQPRRRHASDRDDRTHYWPEALPAHEYVQVNAMDLATVGRSMYIFKVHALVEEANPQSS